MAEFKSVSIDTETLAILQEIAERKYSTVPKQIQRLAAEEMERIQQAEYQPLEKTA